MDKGQGVPFLVKLVIGLAIIVVAYMLIRDITSGTTNTIDPLLASSQWESCKAQGEMLTHEGRNFGDCDMDGFPDSCDNCIDGDNNDDYDGDGMPDLCEQLSTRGDKDKLVCMYKVIGKKNVCGKGPEGELLDKYNKMSFNSDSEATFSKLGKYTLGKGGKSCSSNDNKQTWELKQETYLKPK